MENDTSEISRPPDLNRWIAGPVMWGLYGLMTMGMLAWTWKTWPDSIVDFGKEIYVAWRIAVGQHLYADLAHYSGPLSSYLNGTWLRWAGTSLHSLMGLNFIVWLLIFGLLHRIMANIARPLAVVAAMLFFILVFSFGQYVGIGNYNYLAPYAHEMTHGLLFSLGAVLFAHRWLTTRRLREAGLAGVCLGLSFLTKPEVALPGFAAVGAGILAKAWTQPKGGRFDGAGMAVVRVQDMGNTGGSRHR